MIWRPVMTRIDATRERFLQTVKKTVADYQMLHPGDSVLVGLSGGADSVALLLALLSLQEEYQLAVSCAHINHGLRGEFAKRDMDFVIALCKNLSVPLFVLEEDVGAYARKKGISVEAAGREVRYRFFGEQNTDKIAVAHTKNDCTETLLMNLTKGYLPLGIPPKRGNIIRTLLGVTKEEIYAFLEANGQNFVTDETNFSKEYTRNRIRLEFIPYIEENFNKNFTNTIYNTSDILWQEQDFLEGTVARFLGENATFSDGRISVSAKAVAISHPAIARKAVRRCYYQLAGELGHISFEQIERLSGLCKTGQSGQKIEL
ncbi:MAG: tRNA lysidine(34) synthetase TilS [Clostridia bacterium]|nr:tRNA lysidine(34) synthetase TilS [Clostridia bacterium]